MIKKRAVNADNFIEEAEKNKKERLDTEAPRDYKSLRISFNEYEFQRLGEASKKVGRTKSNFIRQSIKKLIDDVL